MSGLSNNINRKIRIKKNQRERERERDLLHQNFGKIPILTVDDK